MLLSPASLLTTGVALGAVLCAILLAAHFLRRTGLAGPGAQRLRLQETLALDRTRRLYLIACDGREMLVLAGPAGDAPIEWIPAPPPASGANL